MMFDKENLSDDKYKNVKLKLPLTRSEIQDIEFLSKQYDLTTELVIQFLVRKSLIMIKESGEMLKVSLMAQEPKKGVSISDLEKLNDQPDE